MSSSDSTSGTNTAEQATPGTRLEAALGYCFADGALLEQALTHKSHGRRHNERLEFLGDAVLGYVVADRLYRMRPDEHEDSLSIIRSSLVRKETLTEVARELGLGTHLRLGLGERFFTDQARADDRQRVLVLVGPHVVQPVGNHVAKDRVAEELQALVVPGTVTLVSERLLEQSAIGETIPQRGLEPRNRDRLFSGIRTACRI